MKCLNEAGLDYNAWRHFHDLYFAVIPNGRTGEDGHLPVDRRTGRKGRRQRSSTRFADGKHQPLSSEKDNIEVGSGKHFSMIFFSLHFYWPDIMMHGAIIFLN